MKPRLAVLIDAENMSAKHWPLIRGRLDGLGTTVTVRVFGNFTEDRLARWLALAEEEAMQACLQFSGPNAADIAIAVAAMDLLHAGKIEGICLVSSDGDFTPLVHRLRSAGLSVHVFGKANSAPSLRKASTSFVSVTELELATAGAT